MSSPLFSVLMANFNNSDFIIEAIDSMIKQTCSDWELIVVDDGSTDGSIDLLSYYSSNPRIRIYENKENLGVGETKRKCVDLAKGDLCGFLDPDDVLEPRALELMSKSHLENPSASMVHSLHYVCNENLRILRTANHFEAIDQENFLLLGKTPNAFTSFKLSFYKKTDGIDKMLKRAVDRDLVLKLEEVGSTIHIPVPLYYYRVNENSISNNHNSFKAEYWTWIVRFKACDRRGLDKEILYSEIQSQKYSEIVTQIRDSTEYRLGQLLLKPYHCFKYRVYESIKAIIKR